MSRIYDKIFYYEEIGNYIKEECNLFIFHKGNDERDHFFYHNFCEHSKRYLYITYNIEKATFTIDNGIEMDLIADFFGEVEKRVEKPIKVFIDITAMPIALIFYCIQCFHYLNCISIYCGYTTPHSYNVVKEEITLDRYNLTEKFLGIKPLPGFIRSIEPELQRKKLLVLLLGYEGNRASNIYQEVSPESLSTIPVIGFPGFRPGWHSIVFEMNEQIFSESHLLSEYLEYIAADNPFGIYELLKKISENHKDQIMMVSPLGTRINALGAALYAVDHKDCIIIYDNPIDQKNRSRGIKNCLIYDLSDFFTIRNK